MKQLFLALTLCATLAACHNSGEPQKADDPLTAAREFVGASLEGNYDKALFYLYKDTDQANQMILNRWKSEYDALSNADKAHFKDASINVKSLDKISDSVSLFTYSNSYKNIQQTIKVIRINGEWLVDLKDIH